MSKMRRLCTFLTRCLPSGAALVLLAPGIARGAPTYAWIESEKPAEASFEFKTAPHELLSGGAWLSHLIDRAAGKKEVAGLAQPLELEYAFDVAEAGDYAFWLRVGYERVRPSVEWQLDGGPWQTFGHDEPTTNLMSLWPFCEISWGRGGLVKLSAGTHSLRLRYANSGPDGRTLVGLDALAFVRGEWLPEGRLKPGETYDEEVDRQAAGQVFRFPDRRLSFPPGTSGGRQLPDQGPAGRVRMALDGPWQVARYDDPDMAVDTHEPVRGLPAGSSSVLRWRGITVPGTVTRPDMSFAHRSVYRTRVDVPAVLEGRSFLLHLEGTSWIASLFVNGEFVKSSTSVLTPWEADVTGVLVPGQVNTIDLVVKDGYYAMDADGRRKAPSVDHFRNLPPTALDYVSYLAPVFPANFGPGDGMATGILFPVTLVAAGPSYVEDVYVRTSVDEMRLEATVALVNATDSVQELAVSCEAIHERTGTVEKAFQTVKVSLDPGVSETVDVGGAWPDARLWWPSEDTGDRPDCYILRTTVKRGDTTLDVMDERFGFREI